jgi:hypothetical protein
MNKFLKSWLCLVMVVLNAAICLAQDKVEISTNPPAPMVKLPVVKEVGKAQVVYNERTDKTIVQSPFLQVQGNWRNGILLRASFASSGKNIAKPSFITFTFSSAAGDRTYADNRKLKICLDGNQAFSDTARYEYGNTNGQVYLISVKQDVPYDLFLKIAGAKSVRMQIGPTEFELKESDLDALRDVKRAID